jgi:hypothetical protein
MERDADFRSSNDRTDLTTDAGVNLTITKLPNHLSSGVQHPEIKLKVENAINQYRTKWQPQSLSNVPQPSTD